MALCIFCKKNPRTAMFPTCQQCRNYMHSQERNIETKGIVWMFEHERKLETHIALIGAVASIGAKAGRPVVTLKPLERRSQLMAYRGVRPRESTSNVVDLNKRRKGIHRKRAGTTTRQTRARA